MNKPATTKSLSVSVDEVKENHIKDLEAFLNLVLKTSNNETLKWNARRLLGIEKK